MDCSLSMAPAQTLVLGPSKITRLKRKTTEKTTTAKKPTYDNDPTLAKEFKIAGSVMDGTLDNKIDVKDEESPILSSSVIIEEWLKKEGLTDWPVEPELEDFNLYDKFAQVIGLSSHEAISNDLLMHASLDFGILDDFLNQLEELETKFSSYADHFIAEAKSCSKQSTLPGSYSLPGAEEHEGEERNTTEKQQTRVITYRLVERTVFPGFSPAEHMALPLPLEAPQLLNKVSKLQSFTGKFKKMWRHFLLSEFTVGILQDAFWWFFLEVFKNKDAPEKDLLFARIADNFAGLFFSLPLDIKDMFLKHFSDAIAQCIYMGYCQAFSQSCARFGSEFKTTLCTVLSEWTNGVPVNPLSWKRWQLNTLENQQSRTLQEDVTPMAKGSMSFDVDAILAEHLARKTPVMNTPFDNSGMLSAGPGSKAESYPVVRAVEFERLGFNVQGKSPLIMHFLASRGLIQRDLGATAHIITKTDVTELCDQNISYREIIEEHEASLREAALKQKRLQMDHAQQVKQIELERRRADKKLQLLEDEIKNRRLDIKVMSEKIFDSMERSKYVSRRLSSKLQERKSGPSPH